MKFTLSWLKDHLDTGTGVEEIAAVLTDLGLEVEAVTNPAAALRGFTVARVIAAQQHPDADRLRVCRVETDEGERQIVCGAPNARAGIFAVLAKPGMYIPGIDKTIQTGSIRGIESQGMLCSEREMLLSDEHDGIIELPGSPPVGREFADWLAEHRPAKADPMLHIKITPNRPDALGVRGVARDLAARGLGRLKPLEIPAIAGGFRSPLTIRIDPALRERGCPLFATRLIRGVRNGPSPEWLQDRLKAIGLRPLSTLVDITNYVTYDLNRPLHVYDADLLAEGLRIHPATGGEEVPALDERTYRMQPGMMLISDDRQPQAIAGVMGGAPSGCSEATVNVLLESALWDPVTVAATGRRLKLLSDARYRFERGVDPEFALPGLDLATRMILDLCGGEASELALDGAVPDTDRAYPLDTERVQSLVGMAIPAEEQKRTLTALGFRLAADGVHPPSWRPDVHGEADLVEEVARVASLSRLQGQPLPRARAGVPAPVLTPMQRREAAGRRAAAALGYNECVSYSFIARDAAARFGGGTDSVRVENPISSEMTHLRPDLLPGLLAAAARNQARGFADLALFEVGPVFSDGAPGAQRLQIAGLLAGARAARDPFGSARAVDLYDVKADAEAVLAAMGAPAKMQVLRGGEDWWHPGRHGRLCLGPKRVLGTFGELHPRLVSDLGLKGPAVAFTLWPEEIPAARATASTRPPLRLSPFQAVERDFAFVVAQEVEAAALLNAAAGADKALIESVRLFDQFTGPAAEAQMGPGRKSLALTVRLQPQEGTLTDKQIEAVSARIVEKVGKATGAILRG